MIAISESQMVEYRATAAKRKRWEAERLAQRHQFAWEIAQRAATILKAEFGAKRVCVFGSLLEQSQFHTNSDIDLAAWGIDEKLYLRAVSRLLSLSPEITFDLVRMEEATSALSKHIVETGIAL